MYRAARSRILIDLKQWKWFRVICWTVLFAFGGNILGTDILRVAPAYAQNIFMPSPGTLLSGSPASAIPVLDAISVHPEDAYKINFLLDGGDDAQVSKDDLNRLSKYFLTFLTIPEDDLWVNLSPYEFDRIVNPALESTLAGRDMLAQDYILKQLAASMTYPEREPGIMFWEKVLAKTREKFGTTEVPMDIFNKVWVVPEKAVVQERDGVAFIVESRLKVMMEKDYLSMEKNGFLSKSAGSDEGANSVSTEIAREIIIPELEREVNEGKYFAPLRQMFHALILAIWFKERLKNHLVSEVYANQKKTSGISGDDEGAKDRIYAQYLEAFKKGTYNYIREDYDPQAQGTIPRKYFSGGFSFGNSSRWFSVLPASSFDSAMGEAVNKFGKNLFRFTLSLIPLGISSKTLQDSVALAGSSDEVLLGQAGQENVSKQEGAEDKLSAFNDLLASVVNGQAVLSQPEVLGAVVDGVLQFHHDGKSAVIRDRIIAYQRLLETNSILTAVSPNPTAIEVKLREIRVSLTQEQKDAIADVLYIMRQEYLALEPLDGIQTLKVLPFDISVEDGLDQGVQADIARRIVQSQDAIESTIESLSWDGDALFSHPIAVKIVKQNDQDPKAASVEYNDAFREVRIAQSVLSLGQEEFSRQLQQGIQKAELHKIARYFEQEFGNDTADRKAERLTEKVSQIIAKGTPLSEFILYCNMKENLGFEDVNSFLDLVLEKGELGYDQLAIYVDEDIKEEEAHPEGVLTKGFTTGLKGVMNFLKENPAVVMVPMALLAAASAAFAGIPGQDGMGVNSPDNFDPTNRSHSVGDVQADVPQAAVPQEPLVSQHVLSLGSSGEEVVKVGSALMAHVTADDVRHLTGEVNEITGKPYDGDYLSRNAERIISRAQESVQQGVYSRDVERVVVAFQEAHGLAEDGDIGTKVIGELNALGVAQPVVHDTTHSPAPVPVSIPAQPAVKVNAPIINQVQYDAVRVPASVDTMSWVDPKDIPQKKVADKPAVSISREPVKAKPLQEGPSSKVSDLPIVAFLPGAVVSDPLVVSRAPSKVIKSPESSAAIPKLSNVSGVGGSLSAIVGAREAVASQGSTGNALDQRGGGPAVQTFKGSVSPEGAYALAAQVLPMPVDGTLQASSAGIIRGLDPVRTQYRAGEVIFTLENPGVADQKEVLNARLKVSQEHLEGLKNLIAFGATTSLEVNAVEKEIRDLERQLAKVAEAEGVQTVKAPYSISVQNLLASNGQTVQAGIPVLSYQNQGIVRFSVEVPASVTNFGKISDFKINGRTIKSVVRVNWKLMPQKSTALVTFDVVPSEQLSFRENVQVTAKIAKGQPSELAAINGETGTLGKVTGIVERAIASPEEGKVKFFVNEGDKVTAGQVLAEVEADPYLKEYRKMIVAYNVLQGRLNQTASGVSDPQFFSRDEKTRLEGQRDSLFKEMESLRHRMSRLQVIAPGDGIVTRRAEASEFRQGAEILRLRTPRAFVGNAANANEAVLLPSGLNIQMGDPMVVQLPSGERLPARVTVVNRNPYSGQATLKNVQAVQLMVEDPKFSLGENLPVRVIVPSRVERSVVAEDLSKVERERQAAERRVKMESKEVPVKFEEPKSSPTARLGGSPPPHHFQTQGTPIGFGDVIREVGMNYLLTGPLSNQVLQQEILTRLHQSQRNPTSSILSGVMQDIRPIATGGLSEVMDNIETEKAQHRLEVELNSMVYKASDILIEIRVAQERMAHLEELRGYLNKAKSELEARKDEGFALSVDINALARKVSDVSADLLLWRAKERRATIAFNETRGHTGEKLKALISPVIALDGNYPSISETAEWEMLSKLSGSETSNYRLQEAEALLKAAKARSRFKDGVESLNETADMGTIDIVRDKERADKREIITLEAQQAKLRFDQVSAQVRTELIAAVARIRDLSLKIQQAERTYRMVRSVWEEKASRPDIFMTSQLVDERIEVLKSGQRLDDLRQEYLSVETKLRELGVLDPGKSFVEGKKDLPLPSDTVPVLPEPRGVLIIEPTSLAEVVQQIPHRGSESSVLSAGTMSFQAPGGSSHGSVSEDWLRMKAGSAGEQAVVLGSNPSGGSGSEEITLPTTMLNGQFVHLVKLLREEPNIISRADALKMFLGEYRNQRGFVEAVEYLVMTSPYDDVVQQLLTHMAHREDHDVRFFIRVVNRAAQHDKVRLVEWAFQSLSDIFIVYPQIFENLFEETLNPQGESAKILPGEVSVNMAKKVFLNYLLWESSNDSVAKERFLRSNYWNTDRLAQIYSGLREYEHVLVDPLARQGVGPLADLIYDELLRRKALENIDDVFRLGPYQSIPSLYFDEDVFDRFALVEIAKENRDFLTMSPEWRNMKQFLSAKLYARAKEAAESLLTNNITETFQPDSFYHIPAEGRNSSLVSYLSNLSLEDQEKHVRQSQSVAELVRILDSDSTFRAVALDRLMATLEGRVLVLEVYLHSNDSDLLVLIESRSWNDTLKADVHLLKNSASNEILRRALGKMYFRTTEEWPLNVRLSTYTYPELHSADDPRGKTFLEAQIDLKATRMAVDFLLEKASEKPALWAGQPVFNPQENDFLKILNSRIRQSNDPHEVGAYLGMVKARQDPKVKNVLKELIKWRDVIAKKIIINSEDVPKFRLSTKFLMAGIIAFISAVGLWFYGMAVSLRRSSDDKLRKRFVKDVYEDRIKDAREREAKKLAALEKKKNRKDKPKDKAQGSKKDDELEPVIYIADEINTKYRYFLERLRNNVKSLRDPELSPDVILLECNSILNRSFEVLRLTAYKPELMWNEKSSDVVLNDQYQKVLNNLIILVVDTQMALLRSLENKDLTDHQRQRLLSDVDLFNNIMEYLISYLHVLEYRSIIDKVMGYKFEASHWAEKLGFYPFMRWLILDNYRWKSSEMRLKKELPDLLSRGSRLVENLYSDPDGIYEKSVRLLNAATEGGYQLSTPGSKSARDNNKIRSFWSRLRLMSVPLVLAVVIAGAQMGVYGLSLDFSIIGFLGLSIGFSIFWLPHIRIMQVSWGKTIKMLKESLNGKLRKILGGSADAGGGAEFDQDSKKRSVELAWEEGQERVRQELSAASATVDMVVIVPENPNDADYLRNYVDSHRGKLFRDDIRLEVVSSEAGGVKGSADKYFEGFEFVRSKLRNWQNSKVIFVFYGENKEKDDETIEWAVMNAYRGVGNYHGAQHIIVYTRDAYYGPIEPQAKDVDVQLLSNWMVEADLSGRGLLIMDENGRTQVSEILEKLDIPELRRAAEKARNAKALLTFLKNRFDLDKPFIEQYPAIAGVVRFGPRAIRIFDRVLKKLDDDPELRKDLKYLHMTNDVLRVLLMCPDELPGYINRRMNWPDMDRYQVGQEKLRKILQAFYLTLIEEKDDIPEFVMDAFIPRPGSAELFFRDKNTRQAEHSGTSSIEELDQAMLSPAHDVLSSDVGLPGLSATGVNGPEASVGVLDKAQLSLSDLGGLDFSRTRNKIEFNTSGQPDVMPAKLKIDLRLFQGFEFELLQYQPVVSPAEFFQQQ